MEAVLLAKISKAFLKRVLKVLMRGGSPRDAFEIIGAGPRRIWLSAWQSYLFNCVLHRRVMDGTFNQLEEGDLGWLHGSGALFEVNADDAALSESVSVASRSQSATS